MESRVVNSLQGHGSNVEGSRQFAALPEYFVEDISEFMLFTLQ